MTEYQFFIEMIPTVIEIMEEAHEKTYKEYLDWKEEILKAAGDKAHRTTKRFMEKVFHIIENYSQEELLELAVR